MNLALRSMARRRLDHLAADAYLLSYPKCGRTWLRYMIGVAVEAHFGVQSPDPSDLRRLAEKCPGMPRIMVKHDGNPHLKRPDELETSKRPFRRKAVILLVRDPRDVIVSFFHHVRYREARYGGTLTEFIREPVGSVTTLLRYYELWAGSVRVPKRFLLVRYEDIHRDSQKELARSMEFLDLGFIGQRALAVAVEKSSFSAMRAIELRSEIGRRRLRPGREPTEESLKMRRAEVGGYRRYLSAGDIEYIEDLMTAHLPSMFDYSPCRED